MFKNCSVLSSLFNDILTFVGYLMPNLSDSTHSWQHREINNFPQCITRKAKTRV